MNDGLRREIGFKQVCRALELGDESRGTRCGNIVVYVRRFTQRIGCSCGLGMAREAGVNPKLFLRYSGVAGGSSPLSVGFYWVLVYYGEMV